LTPSTRAKPEAPSPAAGDNGVIQVVGRTQCCPKRKALIAPVPLHPVEEVLVSLGDRVKKDQPLVKLDADEQKAEVRGKRAALENAGIVLKEAQRYLAVVEKNTGAISEQKYYEIRLAALKAGAEQRMAKAALESAEAELEHYTVVAPIDGVINALNVNVGMVSRPGTSVWGEIIDLSEIDVRCDLTSDQVDRIGVGQTVEVRSVKAGETFDGGKVVFIGFAADKTTGLIPVLVRLPNPKWRLRCEVPVQVRFTGVKEASR
jgi:RND family efflux transporter MFP subunit